MTLAADLITDLTTFFNSNDFGVVATYGGNSVTVLFWNEYQASQLLDIQDDALGPYALGRSSDFPVAKKNETLVIDGTTYYIDPRPGGTGVTRLILSKVAHG